MRILLLLAISAITLIIIDQGIRSYIDSQVRAELLLDVVDIPPAEVDFSRDGEFNCKVYSDYFPYEYATCMYGHPLTVPKVVDFMYMPPRSILYVLLFGRSHLSTFAGNNALYSFRNAERPASGRSE